MDACVPIAGPPYTLKTYTHTCVTCTLAAPAQAAPLLLLHKLHPCCSCTSCTLAAPAQAAPLLLLHKLHPEAANEQRRVSYAIEHRSHESETRPSPGGGCGGGCGGSRVGDCGGSCGGGCSSCEVRLSIVNN